MNGLRRLTLHHYEINVFDKTLMLFQVPDPINIYPFMELVRVTIRIEGTDDDWDEGCFAIEHALRFCADVDWDNGSSQGWSIGGTQLEEEFNRDASRAMAEELGLTPIVLRPVLEPNTKEQEQLSTGITNVILSAVKLLAGVQIGAGAVRAFVTKIMDSQSYSGIVQSLSQRVKTRSGKQDAFRSMPTNYSLLMDIVVAFNQRNGPEMLNSATKGKEGAGVQLLNAMVMHTLDATLSDDYRLMNDERQSFLEGYLDVIKDCVAESKAVGHEIRSACLRQETLEQLDQAQAHIASIVLQGEMTHWT